MKRNRPSRLRVVLPTGPPVSCKCGCGQTPSIVKETGKGYKKGDYYRCCSGHKESNKEVIGYRTVRDAGLRRQLHRVIAEKALGRPLPQGSQVHHVDGDIQNRVPRLVICQDQKYHWLLHIRHRVMRAGGNPNTERICTACRCLIKIEDFTKDGSRADGRDTKCSDCRRNNYVARCENLGLHGH